jgi:hypothetical protein
VLHEPADERPSLNEVFFQPTESGARTAITRLVHAELRLRGQLVAGGAVAITA